MTVAMGGIEALVFTGGVGEHAPTVRSKAVDQLGFLGIEIDSTLNDSVDSDSEIGLSAGTVRVLVLQARISRIASEVRVVLGAAQPLT